MRKEGQKREEGQKHVKKVENRRSEDVGVFMLMLARILRCRQG